VSHCTDDDLVLHYYGDPEAPAHVGPHLAICGDCRERAEDLAATLQMTVFPGTPDPGERYGAELWNRLAPRLELRRQRSWFLVNQAQGWSLAAAAALLLVAGFVAGRSISERVVTDPAPAATLAAIDASESRRVLLMAVADHLERSDRVLTDVLNASMDGDLSSERQWAADLIADNRFYRQDAIDSGEPSVAAVLDELERALLDIVHSPADATPAMLEAIRERLDSAALLFKVRVLGSQLRHRQRVPAVPSSTRTSSRTS
jgi:hypothetical protein